MPRHSVLGALCVLGLVAAPAWAGEIAGTVRGPGGGPLAGVSVFAQDATGSIAGMASSDAAGAYTITGLAAGIYYVIASQPPGNPEGRVGEIYSGIPCTVNCSPNRGTEVEVGAGTTAGIDLEIRVGGTISGTVTAAGTGLPVSVSVQAFDLRGNFMGSTNSGGAGGEYTIQGLPPGPYYVSTFSGGSRADELYPDLPCGNNQCDFFAGTPVPTGTTGVHFVLAAGSSIAGTIRGPGGVPVQNATVEVWNGTERFGIQFFTPITGEYLIAGLPAQSGFRVFARKAGLVSEVFPDSPCPGGGCPIGSTGTAIDITSPGTAITGKDIDLAAGHSISGVVSPTGQGGTVQVFASNGLAGTASVVSGAYTVNDLPNGVYKVRLFMRGRIAELFDNVPCPGACILSLGNNVGISGANATGVNFVLDEGRKIHGTIRGTNGDPITFLDVEVVRLDGIVMSRGISIDGVYSSDNSQDGEGLPAGSYRVRTRGPAGLGTHLDEIWDDHPCEPGCVPSSGDAVVVAAGADTNGVDFVLTPSDVQFFTVVPCREYDSRVGPPLTSGVTYGLRLEAKCGIPANAVAVSANVTVTAATAPGFVNIWSYNLAGPPPTSLVNFGAGQTRGNNAVITMSLAGLQNVALRGSLAGGGSYHLILDVNGYFAQPTIP